MTGIFLAATFGLGLLHEEGEMLVTGKRITPYGTHVEVGSYPINMQTSPDGRNVVVTNIGYRQFLTVVDAESGMVKQQVAFNKGERKSDVGLYYGLAFQPKASSPILWVSRGAEDRIAKHAFNAAAPEPLGKEEKGIEDEAPKERKMPFHPAGIDFTSDGKTLVAAHNQTTHTSDFKGSVAVYDVESGAVKHRIPVAGFPLGCTVLTEGSRKDQIAYVGSERDGTVEVVDIRGGKLVRSIQTGQAPVGLTLSRDQKRLYVANSASDTVSVVDTATDKVLDTILVRPAAMRGLPGATPTAIALSENGKRLFVTLADMNAIAVIDLGKKSTIGYIPTGWLPTSVIVHKGKLLVSSAKGIKAQNPNNKPVNNSTYIQNVINGTVSHFPIPSDKELEDLTEHVLENNRIDPRLVGASYPGFRNPGIKYVIYIVKENRTYDNVLSDIPYGNGDPSLCLFPREVTPNQHALAERFVLLDNFHVCAEVSQDGWVWSTAGMVNAYASRNTPYNYSGRGRTYDTEGSNNGVPIDLLDIPDVTRPAGGYIWELCEKSKVSFRNYGFFTQFTDALDKRYDVLATAVDNRPTKKALEKVTNTSFRRYDLNYADSPIYDEYDFTWNARLAAFGAYKSTNRFSEWNREFQEFVKKGEMPRFQMVRFGQDHTSGTRAGVPTAKSMVADNDYAVGKVVEAVSNSPFWKETVICVLEDDAQNGLDHVDAHRSTAYVISPYIKPKTHDSRFYNTDSMLRTMELMLGMPPMNQYDAVASPIMVFSSDAVNAQPFKAIPPSKAIVCATNARNAYRAKDSLKISRYIEESEIDEELNDILWRSIKGVKSQTPTLRRGLKTRFEEEDDED